MREARRAALIARQALIAGVARKQAVRGLAEAIEAEARSRALAARACALVAASAQAAGDTTGAGLMARAAFTGGLAQLAANADAAAADATRQCAWAADTLAKAETRSRLIAERAGEADAALAAAKARAEQAREASGMARKLHSRAGA